MDTVNYVVVLAKRIINSCKDYLEKNDFRSVDLYNLEDTPVKIIQDVNFYLVEMEKCQHLLAQMRFDILCQFGQLEDSRVKSSALNMAKAMSLQMIRVLEQEQQQKE